MTFDFAKMARGVLEYGQYTASRDKGVKPDELTFYDKHEDYEQLYLAGLDSYQVGTDIIDSQMAKDRGEMQ